MHFQLVYIGVNYKTPEKAVRWAKSVALHSENSLIVLVDNSRVENENLEEKLIKEKIGNLLYLDTGRNMGYFNGAAYGLHYIEKDHTFEWLVVSNVDLELLSNGISNTLNEYGEATVIAPSIISYDTGWDKNPYRMNRGSKLQLRVKKLVFSNILFANFYGSISKMRNLLLSKKRNGKNSICRDGQFIYLPYGACFIFNKRYFENGCKIDFPFFLFGEELYVAEQCYKKNLDIIYVSEIIFKNYEHASTKMLTNRFIQKCNYKMIKYILNEFY